MVCTKDCGKKNIRTASSVAGRSKTAWGWNSRRGEEHSGSDLCLPAMLEGYPHVLHGGVICALLDGAMTNCVFASGSAAVTGDLHVRFRKPVATCGSATVRAWIEASSPPLYKLAAQLEQDGEIKATAKARFVERDAACATSGRIKS